MKVAKDEIIELDGADGGHVEEGSNRRERGYASMSNRKEQKRTEQKEVAASVACRR